MVRRLLGTKSSHVVYELDDAVVVLLDGLRLSESSRELLDAVDIGPRYVTFYKGLYSTVSDE